MKIRTDFVSNSSSSSYVFSIDFSKYKFDDFVRDVCSQCDAGENSERVRQNNDAMLRYCLRFFELLHLGQLVKGRRKDIYKKGYGYAGEKLADGDDQSNTPFEYVKQSYIDSRKPDEFDCEHMTAKMTSDDTIECEYDDFAPDHIVVLRHYMSDVIRDPYCMPGKSAGERLKRRVSEILKVIKYVDSDEVDAWRTPAGAETYLITKNTIANTRDLIAAGRDVRLDKWEDLDALEARLDAGETLCRIGCGDSGEGECDNRLFSFGPQYPFKDLPVETLPHSYE